MRYLAIVCLSFSAAVFLANYLLPLGALPWLSLLCLVLAILFYLRWWSRALVLALFGLAFGLGIFGLHAQRTTLRCDALDGETIPISGTLLSYPVVYEDYCRAELRLCTDGLPREKLLLYDDSMTLAALEPGQKLSMEAALHSAGLRYGERYDNYYSKDIYLTANARSPIQAGEATFDLRLLPLKLSHRMTDFVAELFPEDTAAFAQSLMLGDKRALYEQPGQYQHLSRAGLAHVVAVSGMHISYLVGFLQLLFGKSRRLSLLVIGFIWFFVLLTGASPSAVRAGIMQTVVLLAPVFRRENDTWTSLSFALAVILLENPYASGSISLQLSFGAMAGILAWAPPFQAGISRFMEEKGIPFPHWLAANAATSAAGMIFTVPLVAIHFGVVNLLSILSNVMALWAVSLCFVGAYLACGLALLFFPLGNAVAWLVSWPMRYILLTAELVSALPFSTVYLVHGITVVWLLLSYVLFVLAAFSKLRPALRLSLPLGLSLSMLLCSFWMTKLNYQSARAVITALDVGQGQCVAVFAGEKSLMVDCGGLGTLENAGDTATAYLSACGREGLDLLVLSHLHADHTNGVVDLLEQTRVGALLLPAKASDEDGLRDEILEVARRRHVDVIYLDEDEKRSLGAISMELLAPLEVGDANERGLVMQLSVGDYDVLIPGDASYQVERRLLKEEKLRPAELLVVGHHGSRYSSCGDLLQFLQGETAIISCGYNTYGHPTHETLERLAACGYNILRTDLSGNIEIRLG